MRTLLASLAILVSVQSASAQLNMGYNPSGGQGFGAGSRPNLSPYLNLLRGGNTAANYFLGVRPEVQRRQNASMFGLAITDLERRTANTPEEFAPTSPVASGTYVYLSNTGPYFNNTGAFFPTPGRPASTLSGQAQRPGRRGPSSGTQPMPR